MELSCVSFVVIKIYKEVDIDGISTTIILTSHFIRIRKKIRINYTSVYIDGNMIINYFVVGRRRRSGEGRNIDGRKFGILSKLIRGKPCGINSEDFNCILFTTIKEGTIIFEILRENIR